MRLRVKRTKTATHLYVSGEMPLEQIHKLKKALEDSMESSGTTVISMEKATNMHFSYLPLLCSAHKTSLGKGGNRLVLKGETEVLDKALKSAGFSRSRGCIPSSGKKTCLWVENSDA